MLTLFESRISKIPYFGIRTDLTLRAKMTFSRDT